MRSSGWENSLNILEIMTQGETLEELEENLRDAYMLMTMDDVPPKHKVKRAYSHRMKRKDLIKKISAVGCVLVRHGHSHDLTEILKQGKQPAPRHNEIDENLAKHT